MSIKSAEAFLEKIREDRDFAASFRLCSDNKSKIEFIKEHGFEFTGEEIEEVKLIFDASGGVEDGYTGMVSTNNFIPFDTNF